MSFAENVLARMGRYGPVCAGIDPHPNLLESWGLADTPDGLRSFSLTVVEALAGHVAALKPQSAFFERHGAAGIGVLEEVLAACRSAGVPAILDVKRGDIGSTMAGYADAYSRGPLEADAITLSPYLGPSSLGETVRTFSGAGKGVFLLALTSNPEGREVQHARIEESSVAGHVVARASEWNNEYGAGGVGPVGIVVGATIGTAARDLGIDLAGFNGLILSPGVGAQGAGATELRAVFGASRARVLASASRSILTAGPSPASLQKAAAALADSLHEASM